MSRITETFNRLKTEGRKGFIPFVTAGDPDMDTSLEILFSLADAGADIIELGVPFTDPMADGPTIQLSSQRALQNGVNLEAILVMTGKFRAKLPVPLVLFSYLNPLLQFGIENLAKKASEVGIDGVLITDAVGREASGLAETFGDKGIDLISLIAPTTSDARLPEICSVSTGFIYAVSRAGVTGAREEMSTAAEKLVNRARKVTDLPIAVGFGISTRQQLEEVWRFADAAVVGSAIVREIERSIAEGTSPERVKEFAHLLLPPFAKHGS